MENLNSAPFTVGSRSGWVIVELFGKEKTGGVLVEHSRPFFHLEVPAVGEKQGATLFLHENSVFRISPTDEKTVKILIENDTPPPFSEWKIDREIADRINISKKEDWRVDAAFALGAGASLKFSDAENVSLVELKKILQNFNDNPRRFADEIEALQDFLKSKAETVERKTFELKVDGQVFGVRGFDFDDDQTKDSGAFGNW